MRFEDELDGIAKDLNRIRQWLEDQTRVPTDRLLSIADSIVSIEGECRTIRRELERLDPEAER